MKIIQCPIVSVGQKVSPSKCASCAVYSSHNAGALYRGRELSVEPNLPPPFSPRGLFLPSTSSSTSLSPLPLSFPFLFGETWKPENLVPGLRALAGTTQELIFFRFSWSCIRSIIKRRSKTLIFLRLSSSRTKFKIRHPASKVVKLKAFDKFENTADALGAATALVESKLSKGLKKFVKAQCQGETLAVADSKLGNIIKEKLGVTCVHNAAVMELMRGVRSHLSELIAGLSGTDLAPMSLGLSHSLSRYKLKFSPDKVDTMIVQAIGLLDDLDKELNTYAMRVREWYGWHFPELAKIVSDNLQYARAVKLMAHRVNAADLDFSGILEEDVESAMKDAAVISMGTEVSEHDMTNIIALCDQILGAEKALFRALKTKHDTPKYGLIFHASLIGQAPPKLKGKISRVLAAKCSLAIRVDALGDATEPTVGIEGRAKIEQRLRQLEGRVLGSASAASKGKAKLGAYDKDRKEGMGGLITPAKAYNPASDALLTAKSPATDATPAAREESAKKAKKEKKAKKDKENGEATPSAAARVDADGAEPPSTEKKKKKKRDREEEGKAKEEAAAPVTPASEKKKKKKDAAADGSVTPGATDGSAKKKKKAKEEDGATPGTTGSSKKKKKAAE
ncbi:unnamed protein product [Closterium sp. NIES-54]